MKSFSYKCPLINQNLNTLPAQDFTSHIVTCQHCAAPGFHKRHNEVASIQARTFRHHGIAASYEPKDATLPGNTKGGPDIRLLMLKPTYIDVAICGDPSPQKTATLMNQRYQEKIKKYNKVENFSILPMVMSIYGNFLESSLQPIKQFCQIREFGSLYPDLIQNSLAALVRGLYFGYLITRNRGNHLGDDLALQQLDEKLEERNKQNLETEKIKKNTNIYFPQK